MRFRIKEHDVTSLCALVDLPKPVIVDELPPQGGRARFQVQRFTSGAVGELLDWLAPVIRGARVRGRDGEFAFARIEVENAAAAVILRDALRAVKARGLGEMKLAAELEGGLCAFELRVRGFYAVVGRVGWQSLSHNLRGGWGEVSQRPSIPIP